jgi:ribosome maturation factor RimP
VDSYELEERIERLLETTGYRLISANWKPVRGRQILRVTADAEDHNITIQECADLSRQIGDLLDSYPHDFPDYVLEVSSPGLNRPLELWQFEKNLGRKLEVKYTEDARPQSKSGELVELNGEEFVVKVSGKPVRFNMNSIDGAFVKPSLK